MAPLFVGVIGAEFGLLLIVCFPTATPCCRGSATGSSRLPGHVWARARARSRRRYRREKITVTEAGEWDAERPCGCHFCEESSVGREDTPRCLVGEPSYFCFVCGSAKILVFFFGCCETRFLVRPEPAIFWLLVLGFSAQKPSHPRVPDRNRFLSILDKIST